MGRTLCVMTPFAGLFGPTTGQQVQKSVSQSDLHSMHLYPPDCRSCIHLEMGTVVGIIVADIVLTLLIALSIFCFVSRLKRNRLEALEGKGKTQTTPKRKKPEVESPYQELQGAHSDVYSDLRQYRK